MHRCYTPNKLQIVLMDSTKKKTPNTYCGKLQTVQAVLQLGISLSELLMVPVWLVRSTLHSVAQPQSLLELSMSSPPS